ncbi:hypothetical protein QLQ12_18905 [Actinoplanes sp. NEAU-A12]|uniref:Uncharacterized protein n=1 Tax=Actinoplanes sandaracinus TaxID=3045177 RepID=A0ABT6WLT0_9ACTN|nr:hypothetical protein [Actinoplanes sandaracinus]MDI6100682.1 hypothetical protein [Actinoplanes sandaracinus]
MTLIEEELRAALRAEAAVHRPDREAMLDRIGRTAVRNHAAKRRPAPRLRIAGAAAAVAAVLGGGGFAQWAVAGDSEPRPGPIPTAVVTVAPTPSAPASSSATGPTTTPASSPSRTTKSRSAGRSASPSTAPGGGTATAKNVLWADGSVIPDGDSQASSVVTVTTGERLTALEVTIRVARTPGLVARGGSQQVPGASVTSTVTEEGGAMVYRFVLSSGDTVEPGTYTFSARYTYPKGGRDANGDSYAGAATTGDGAAPAVSGDFR